MQLHFVSRWKIIVRAISKGYAYGKQISVTKVSYQKYSLFNFNFTLDYKISRKRYKNVRSVWYRIWHKTFSYLITWRYTKDMSNTSNWWKTARKWDYKLIQNYVHVRYGLQCFDLLVLTVQITLLCWIVISCCVCLSVCVYIYLLTYLLTYLHTYLLHGAESFLRS